MSFASRIYSSSPVFLQNLLCSIEGWRVRRAQIGGGFKDFLSFSEAFDLMPESERLSYQLDRLSTLCHHAVNHVPYYKSFNVYSQSIKDLEDFSNFPVLEKEVVRARASEFISDMWAPDAYEGAPTPAMSFMAVAVKSDAFAMLVRVLLLCFGDAKFTSWGTGWPPAFATLAVLTMTVANLIAGRQESVKRMLAYSSIAHAGYLLVGVISAVGVGKEGTASVLFYLVGYTVSTMGALGALIYMGSRGVESVSYEDLAGIARRHPGAAFAMSFFLLSLAGVPPSAGFFGKLYVFKAAVGSGYYWLAAIGLVNSVIGAYYYLFWLERQLLKLLKLRR